MRLLKGIIIALSILFSTSMSAQSEQNPVTWKVSYNQLAAGEYEIVCNAKIAAPWHLYDLGPYGEYGPNPTVIAFEKSTEYTTVGKPYMKTAPVKKHDPTFDMQIGYFADKAQFAQKIKLNGASATVRGNVEWMVCNDNSCLPPADEDFSVTVGEPEQSGVGREKSENKDNGVVDSKNNGTRTKADAIKTDVANAASALTTATDVIPATSTDSTASADSSSVATIGTSASGNGTLANAEDKTNKSLWTTIIEAILWGFAALLTPCVFPMVPMTVSFFMKGEGGAARGRFMALMYGFFIVALYTIPIAIIILTTRIVGGDAVTADIFNWLATHWVPNVLFFIVFMLFAASFFGAFEITMPSWLVNRSDSKASEGGFGGLFFMALTLVLVSFSCTGPIVGSVLIKSTAGEFWEPIITMFAFSTAFALPFVVLALFPSLIKGLPKSGGWLNSVKVVLGFIEVALGLKFLSVADQTYHWELLDREVYLAIWIVVFALLGLYLLGKLKFGHDSDVKHVTVTRLFLSIAVFGFVVYLVPGMFGAPLKGLSGYLPPLHTQDFVIPTEVAPAGQGSATGYRSAADSDRPVAKYSDFLSLPHGLDGFFDYNQAVEYARKVKKPLLVDFTGHGCVNCREMEARVWSNPEVLKLMRENYVIVALYSDDKKVLPESDWVTTESGKVLKSLGKINSYFAHKQFAVNAQPYYMILNDSGRQIVPARGYDLNVAAFVDFLQTGVKAYKNGNE